MFLKEKMLLIGWEKQFRELYQDQKDGVTEGVYTMLPPMRIVKEVGD